MKTVLITGANGFIGSFITEAALSKDWTTWAGVRKTGNREYLQDPRIRFIDLNYNDKDCLKQQIVQHRAQYGRWDYVVHNAGLTKCLDYAEFDRVNYQYTKNLIEALQDTGNVPDKFLLMSSFSAHHPQVKTRYGHSKLQAEQFLQSQTNFPYMILCPTGVYGPRDKDYFLMLKTIQSGWDLTVGRQAQQLTFIYVKDLAKAVVLALESPLTNRRYDVADGQVYSDAQYTQLAQQALGKKRVMRLRVPIFGLKLVSVVAETIARCTRKASTLNRDKYEIMKQRDWRCDPRPIETELGFRADYNLQRGLEESVAWYRSKKWLK